MKPPRTGHGSFVCSVFVLHLATGVHSGASTSGLAAFLLAWFFIVAVGAKLLHHAFLVHDLLQSTQCAFDRFTFFQSYLNHGIVSPSLHDQGGVVRQMPFGRVAGVNRRKPKGRCQLSNGHCHPPLISWSGQRIHTSMGFGVTDKRLVTMLCLLAAASLGCRRAGYLDDRERENRIVAKAYELSNQGDYNSAIRLFSKALEAYPRLARPHFDIALLLHDRKQDYVMAIYHYNRYLALREDTEKREMIRDRIRQAERAFAADLMAGSRSSGVSVHALQQENGDLKEKNASLVAQVEELEAELAVLREKQRKAYIDSVVGTGGTSVTPPAAVDSSPERPSVTPAPPVTPTASELTTEPSPEETETEKPLPQPSPRIEATPSSPSPAAAFETATVVNTYTVRPGDSLSKIAYKVYGDATQWRRIQDANREALGSSVNVKVGQVLVIP
jgi:tetratricopeptide (TPR) repeat protein